MTVFLKAIPSHSEFRMAYPVTFCVLYNTIEKNHPCSTIRPGSHGCTSSTRELGHQLHQDWPHLGVVLVLEETRRIAHHCRERVKEREETEMYSIMHHPGCLDTLAHILQGTT